MNIIGISAYYHDSACALIKDGKLVCAIAEERFSRLKNDARLPIRSFRYCLDQGDLDITDIDCIAYYEDPKKKLERQLATYRKVDDIEDFGWLDADKPIRDLREKLGYEGEIKIYDHHQSHAASSFFFSGFENSAILTSDGVGEWTTTSFGRASGNKIELFDELRYPHSVGLLYSTITNFLGFKVLSGEYKVMGLAPYGNEIYADKIRALFDLSQEGKIHLNPRFFDFSQKYRMFTDAMVDHFELPARMPESDLKTIHKDIAKSLQVVLEEVLLTQAKWLRSQVDSENLCMAGGVALNCVANQKIRNSKIFENLFVQPASGDAGSSLGAAALAHLEISGERIERKPLKTVYLGTSYSNKEVKSLLDSLEVEYQDYSQKPEQLLNRVVDEIDGGKVIGWFQGRMEFGPRALGARSILADPRREDMRNQLNAMVKKREAFRPFAPAILADVAGEYLEMDVESPFMVETCKVKLGFDLHAVTHVDQSCRPQTVSKINNPKFYRLLNLFFEKTGVPILVNTSFNVRGEPIVCSPLDAIRCLGNSGIDILVIEDFIVERSHLSELFTMVAGEETKRLQQAKNDSVFTKKSSDGVYTFI
ncbi:carbamoyltransferase [Aeromonas veronii]|uniref:carbamoyltransferase family protein n=1 Tax=Aeromonas veronii TaxID=654 RepID=UPI000946C426|nr:carbamoyltransferase [Aeromonas veronii]OLF58436.1 carbamoyltransferase [Aeromonas veronii]